MKQNQAKLTIHTLDDPGYKAGWTFFKEMEKYIPDFLPTKIDQYTIKDKEFKLTSADDFKKYWDFEFWFKKKTMLDGRVYLNSFQKNHTDFDCDLKLVQLKTQEPLKNFFLSVSKSVNSDISVLQYPFKEEHFFRIENESGWKEKWNGMVFASILLRKYLPDLYSCQIFGKSYVDLFGMDRLLSAPAPIVKKLSDHQVYLQLNSDLDVISYEELEANRALVKKHLGEDAFFQIEKGRDYKYKVPNFPPLPEPKGEINVVIGNPIHNQLAELNVTAPVVSIKLKKIRKGRSVTLIANKKEKENKNLLEKIRFFFSNKQSPSNTTIDLFNLEQGMESLAYLFVNSIDEPLISNSNLKPEMLDYSIDSLDHINSFLDTIHKNLNSIPPEKLTIIVLRVGAYIGEVIRKNGKKNNFKWISYKTTVSLWPEIEKIYGETISTVIVLSKDKPKLYNFPLGKVWKYIHFGNSEDVKEFAVNTLSKNTKIKSSSNQIVQMISKED